jgi:hypothetical protein
MTPSGGLSVAKEGLGLRSDECDKLAGEHIRLVLGAFLGCQLALIALASKLLDTGFRSPIRAVVQNLPGIVEG